MESFEEIYKKSIKVHLTEKLIDGTKNELQRLAAQAQNSERLHYNIYTKIKDTPFKYLSSDKNVLEYTLYDIMEFIIKEKVGVFYFIENKENKIIAFISYYEDENDSSIIKSVKMANFYTNDEKDDEIYKVENKDGDVLFDTLELMNDLLKEYREVNFSASIYNERFIKSYDIFFKKHKGDLENRVQDGNEINWKIIQ
jgi:hypothetical protein